MGVPSSESCHIKQDYKTMEVASDAVDEGLIRDALVTRWGLSFPR